MRLISLTWIFLSTAVWGAEVLRVGASQTVIAVSHEPNRQWKLSESLCVLNEGEEVVCGKVLKTTPQMAVVKLFQPSDMVARGQTVKSGPTAKAASAILRKPAAAPLIQSSVDREKESQTSYHNFSGGFSVGNGFYFPLLHFQRLVSSAIAVGVMPSYFNVSTGAGSLSALGAMATFNYYGHEFFRGLWLQVGMGLSFFSSSGSGVEQQSTSMASLGTLGWRGYWDLGFNIGIGGGFYYFKDPNFSSYRISGAGFQPLALVDVGFNF